MTDALVQAAAVSQLAEAVKAADVEAKRRVLEEYGPGDRVEARVNKESIGTVSVAKGRESFKVVDDAAFLAWVEEHHPGEVETVKKVRDGFRKNIGQVVKDTGEVPDGVEPTVGDPYVSVRKSAGQKQAFAGLYREGYFQRVLELEGDDA